MIAGEAYADSAIVDLAIKAVTRRERPIDVRPGAPFTDTFFSGGKSPFRREIPIQRQQLSLRPRCWGVFSSNRCGEPLSQASVGTLARLWGRNSDQLFPRNYRLAFSFGRFPGSGTRIHDYTLSSAGPTINLRRAKLNLRRQLYLAIQPSW
jgi:hypothetical protein